MDKQCSQEHSNKGDAFSRVVKPNLAEPMQLQLLPPDILRDILSWLSIKQFVRMSILSREWRRLRICHPDLVFTKDTFGINTAMDIDKSMTVGELLNMHAKKLELLNRKFIDNVDSVLRPLWSTSTTLDKFVIKFGLRREHKHYIDRWVSFSITSRAKHIALDFTSDGSSCDSGFDKYVFPLCDLSGPNGSCIMSLDLGYIFLKLPLSFCGITNLKKLTLKMVSINGGDLQRLLLSCALLESLSIEMCSDLSSLCVPQELSQLQYLRVRYCGMKMLELHAPNLTNFVFDDSLMHTVLSESSKLSEAIFVSNLRVLNGYDDVLDDIFTELPAALPHMDTLLLLLTSSQVQRFSNTRDSFICLRHLNMNLNISLYPDDDSWVMGFVNLLELAPLLEELELHMDHYRHCSSNLRMVTAAQGPLHRHLKSVYMSGFSDVSGLAELAFYILENAIVLERMVVDPVTGMKEDLNTERFYSVSKAGSSEEFVLPTEGDRYCLEEMRLFAKMNLDREEFRHVLTVL
ncbi:F-box/LRR-repeat protein At3g03360 isoform X2 [Lolium perenne]|nr:putative FBD-associated F-box protein At5g56390 isoform X2 [Lolium perenne]